MENNKKIQELERKLAEKEQTIQELRTCLDKTVNEHENLLDACKNINSTLDMDKLLMIIMQKAAHTSSAETSSILLIDEATDEFYFRSIAGEKNETLRTIRFPKTEGIAGHVAETMKPIIINDAQNDAHFYKKVDEKSSFITRSMIAVPLMAKGKLIGVIEVINKLDQQDFNEKDVELLIAFANQVAMTIENAKLYQNLEQEKRKIETIVNSMADGVIVTNENQDIELINPAAKDIFSYSGDYTNNEALKLILEELSQIKDDSLTDIVFMQPMKLILSNKLTVLKDDRAGLNGLIFVLRNITELKNDERRKSEFLTVIAHKLSEPFEQLCGELKENNSKEIQKYISMMKDMMLNLIYFSEIESGPMRLGRKRVKLEEMLHSAIKEYNCTDISFNINIDDTLEEVNIDIERIEQVFLKLIDNALKYSEENRPIIIDISQNKTHQVVSITNYGKILSDELLVSIFDKYYHVEGYLNNTVKNVGLGLAFVQHIIEAHGGTITAENLAANNGCKFTFTIVKE